MIVGKKHVNNAIFYTIFKKHYCPACGTKLTRVKTSKIVNSRSPEAMILHLVIRLWLVTWNLFGKSFIVRHAKKEFRLMK